MSTFVDAACGNSDDRLCVREKTAFGFHMPWGQVMLLDEFC